MGHKLALVLEREKNSFVILLKLQITPWLYIGYPFAVEDFVVEFSDALGLLTWKWSTGHK